MKLHSSKLFGETLLEPVGCRMICEGSGIGLELGSRRNGKAIWRTLFQSTSERS